MMLRGFKDLKERERVGRQSSSGGTWGEEGEDEVKKESEGGSCIHLREITDKN